MFGNVIVAISPSASHPPIPANTAPAKRPWKENPSIYLPERLSESSGILEGKTRIARMQRRGIADPYAADEIRFDACAVKEGFVDGCVVEPRHRPAVEA